MELVQNENAVRRIRRISKFMSRAIVGTATLLIVANAAVWAVPGWLEAGIVSSLGIPAGVPVNLDGLIRLAGFVLSSVFIGILVYGLWRAKGMLDEFAVGRLFSPRVAACLKTVARVTLLLSVAGPLLRTLYVLLFTISNPQGQRIIQFGISSSDVMVVLIGGLLFAVALVLGEAVRLAEDSRLIV